MKKLLKLLFISTMAAIPLSSSVVLAACSFSMDETSISVSGVKNNLIYIDAQPDKSIPGDDWVSPRKDNKIIDIKIKNPQKGYVITWKIKNNVALVGAGEVPLIAVKALKNAPGTSDVSLQVRSLTHITVPILKATITFEYYNDSTKTTIVPDIKNRSVSVDVHQITQIEASNTIDLSKLDIDNNYSYNFNDPISIVKKETFIDDYIVNFIDSKINKNGLDFVLGTNYKISVNGTNNEESINEIIQKFYKNEDGDSTININIESTGKLTEKRNILTGEFNFSFANIVDGKAAPSTPGAPSPSDDKTELQLSSAHIESYTYSFKNSSEEFVNNFPKNYIKDYVEEIIDSKFGKNQINSTDNYIVTLDNDGASYNQNFWEDSQQVEAIKPFFEKNDSLFGTKMNQVNFVVNSRDNQQGKVIAVGQNKFSFFNDDLKEKAPTFPGVSDNNDVIKIPFNLMFNGASIDLTEMGDGNTDSTLLKEGDGGLILEKAIKLANIESVKASVSKGFNVFHKQINTEANIKKSVWDKKFDNAYFDQNTDGVKDKFISIIADKSNWTVKTWTHTGLVSAEGPGSEANPEFYGNKMSTITYALTVAAKKLLKNINIVPEVDLFQFPMYIETKPNPTRKWEKYYGHENFKNYYTENKMGLILGDNVDYISENPGQKFSEDEKIEKWYRDGVLTQQALGTFAEDGIPAANQTFYLTSGADFSVGSQDENKTFKFEMKDSDFFEVNQYSKSDDVRGIYGNDLMKKIVEIYIRNQFASSNGVGVPMNAEFEAKKILFQYKLGGGGDPEPESVNPLEIGNEVSKPQENTDSNGLIQKVSNAYMLDLTGDKNFSFGATDWPPSINFGPNNDMTSFNRTLFNSKTPTIPSEIKEWKFLDENGKVGVTKEQEENWLKYNVYKLTNENRAGLTVPGPGITGLILSNKADKIIDNDYKEPTKNFRYLWIYTPNSFGNGSELTGKSIEHIIIKVNNK